MSHVRIMVFGAVALLAAAAAYLMNTRQHAAVQQRAELALLTSLPILFGESFALDAPASPLRTRLESEYTLAPIAVADAQSLSGKTLLFMAHARAQPAEALDDLDTWVRGGGHLLILTDPLLSWHSERPLGDSLRPPISFADTGLLAHWGISLTGPNPVGQTNRTIDGSKVTTTSPGTYQSASACTVEADGFVARCRIGKGVVTLIADADWINVSEGADARDSSSSQNLDVLARELARLRQN